MIPVPGKEYKIRFAHGYPNDHFQQFMLKYIGRTAIIHQIGDIDVHGFRVIHAELKHRKTRPNGIPMESIGGICWREYDFEEFTEPIEPITLPEELFEL